MAAQRALRGQPRALLRPCPALPRFFASLGVPIRRKVLTKQSVAASPNDRTPCGNDNNAAFSCSGIHCGHCSIDSQSRLFKLDWRGWRSRGEVGIPSMTRSAGRIARALADLAARARNLGLTVLVAKTAPSAAHDWYSGLVSPTGQRCCSGRDCVPVAHRYNPGTHGGNRYPGRGSVAGRHRARLFRKSLARPRADAGDPLHHSAGRGITRGAGIKAPSDG